MLAGIVSQPPSPMTPEELKRVGRVVSVLFQRQTKSAPSDEPPESYGPTRHEASRMKRIHVQPTKPSSVAAASETSSTT